MTAATATPVTPSPPAPATAPRFLTADELAEILRVEVYLILRWAREGKLPHVRLSAKNVRFEPAKVSAALGVTIP